MHELKGYDHVRPKLGYVYVQSTPLIWLQLIYNSWFLVQFLAPCVIIMMTYRVQFWAIVTKYNISAMHSKRPIAGADKTNLFQAAVNISTDTAYINTVSYVHTCIFIIIIWSGISAAVIIINSCFSFQASCHWPHAKACRCLLSMVVLDQNNNVRSKQHVTRLYHRFMITGIHCPSVQYHTLCFSDYNTHSNCDKGTL